MEQQSCCSIFFLQYKSTLAILPAHPLKSKGGIQMRFKDMDEERKKVDELTKAHQNLRLEGENYLIRPFQDMAEIEREGELLHHAIAYYAIDRYAKGKDYLFAMRKASEPDTPFISLEFSSGGKLEEARKDCNRKVTDREELEFIQSFRYVMEVRFANKLVFSIQVDEVMQDELTLPVLSLLPLVENVTVHNMIDSEHKMEIIIRLNEQKELVVSNPIYPKLSPPDTNGTGLKNLENRFALLMNRQIRIECDENTFRVYLPLNKQN